MASMKISDRDKLLIYFCVLFVIGAGIYMLAIRPLNTKIEEYQTINQNAEFDISNREGVAKMLEVYRENNAISTKDLFDESEKFADNVYSEKIDRFLTDSMLKYELTPQLLSIGEIGNEVPQDYNEILYPPEQEPTSGVSIESSSSDSESSGESSESEEPSEPTYTTDSTIVSTVPVMITATGSFDNINKFIGYVSKQSYARITMMNISPEVITDEEETPDVPLVQPENAVPKEVNYMLTMSVEIYSFDANDAIQRMSVIDEESESDGSVESTTE